MLSLIFQIYFRSKCGFIRIQAGFSEVFTWEQRKVGELASDTFGGGTPSTSNADFWNGSIPWIQSSDLTEHQVFGVTPRKYISKAAVMSSATKIVPENSIAIITRVGVGKLAVMPFSYTTSQDFLSLSKLNVDANFAVYMLYKKLQSELNSVQGTSIKGITKDELLAKVVFVPDSKEQEAIGALFRSLDDLITLHQRMCVSFGCTLQIRKDSPLAFAWEQRKLGEVGKARSGIGFPDIEQGGVSGIPFFKVSDMNTDGNENEMIVANNYVSPAQITAHKWTPISELPAIFFAKVGAAVMLNRKRLCRFPFLLDNNTMAYSLNADSWDSDFAKSLFETVDLTKLVQVGALPSYNSGDIEDMEVMLPDLVEQRKIGTYFKELDNLITLHQRKQKADINSVM